MSKATKRKHVTKEAVDDYFVPEGVEEIVKINASRGNNLHEVENAHGEKYLVSMPTKFRKNIWVKRGDFVVTEPIKEGNKVQGEIVYILLAKQIKYLKNEKLWPKEFDASPPTPLDNPSAGEKNVTNLAEKSGEVNGNGREINGNHKEKDSCSESDSSDSDHDELFENPNHRPMIYMPDSSSDDSGSEDSGESDDIAEGETYEMPGNSEFELEKGIATVKLK